MTPDSRVCLVKNELEKLDELKSLGIEVNISGDGRLYIDNIPENMNGGCLKVFAGRGSYVMSLPPASIGKGRLNLEAYFHGKSGHLTVGMQSHQQNRYVVRLWGNNNKVTIGDGTTSNGTEIVVQGENRKIIVGNDCMFARGVWIRNSDMHAIFDIDSKERINPDQDVIIHDHVWLGQDVFVRGCCIGMGSIIGARSMCTKDIDSFSLCAGTPARKIKENVSWDRSLNVTEETLIGLGLTE